VNLADEHSQREIEMPVASSMCRAALTDEPGRFKMAPMAPGQYTVAVEEYPHDINVDYRRVTPKSLPAVFISKEITIEAGAEPEPVRLEAVPQVVIRGQYYDSKGKPCRGHAISVFGRIRGRPFHTQGRPDKNGKIVCMAPRGLENAQIDLMTNEHGALRYRLSPDEKLRPESARIMLGTLLEDIEHLEIVRYTAPIVLVKAVDEAKRPVEGFKVSADYAWTKQLEQGTRYVLGDGVTSDVNFEKQEDGRYRSSQLLPDEEVTITATADGYEPASRKLNLREGETEELARVLKKQP